MDTNIFHSLKGIFALKVAKIMKVDTDCVMKAVKDLAAQDVINLYLMFNMDYYSYEMKKYFLKPLDLTSKDILGIKGNNEFTKRAVKLGQMFSTLSSSLSMNCMDKEFALANLEWIEELSKKTGSHIVANEYIKNIREKINKLRDNVIVKTMEGNDGKYSLVDIKYSGIDFDNIISSINKDLIFNESYIKGIVVVVPENKILLLHDLSSPETMEMNESEMDFLMTSKCGFWIECESKEELNKIRKSWKN